MPVEQALECVLGFTAANDVSARCWQSDTSDSGRCLAGDQDYHPQPIGQWSFSKSFDSHCPLGPALLTTDEPGFADGSGLLLTTRLNGKVMQNQTTSDLIFNISAIVAYLTQGTTVSSRVVIASDAPTHPVAAVAVA